MQIKKTAMIFATTAYMIDKFNKPNIELLQKMGYKVCVAANFKEPGPMSPESVREFKLYLKKMDVELYDLPIPRNPVNFISMTKSYIKLREIMEGTRFDLVHSHSPTGGVIGRLAANKYRERGLKSIYTAHGFHFYNGAPLKNWVIYYPMEKFLSIYTDVLITINSEDYQRAINNKFRAKEISFIPGVGVDDKKHLVQNSENKRKIRGKLSLKENDFVLSYVAELNSNKNQKMLIEMMSILLKKSNKYKLLLIGTGPNKLEYEEMIAKYNMENSVILLGYREDINELLSITDVYVASSYREGLPVNIVEAMIMGLSIVATNVRGHSELIKHESNGFLVESGNFNLFASKVEYLANNEVIRKEMGNNSLEMSKQYTFREISKYYRTIYRTKE